MTLRHPFRSVLLVLAMGAALSGAGLVQSAPGDTLAFRINLERWNARSESQRDELRARWRRWMERPASQRAQAEARCAVLRRLRQRMELSGTVQATPDRLAAELTWELEGLTQQVRREAPDAPTDIGLSDAVDLLLRRRVEAFLDHLQARGRLAADEHAQLLALPTPALAEAGLRRLKAEHLALLGAPIAAQLAECDPRDVAARIDQLRRQAGFLGRAGDAWPLTIEERESLAALPSDAQVRASLRQMKAPAVRERLLGRPLAAEQVDALLELPWNELERSLNELLAAG